MTTPLYDDLSADYDRFVNWPSRLGYELPFLQRELTEHGARRVLDTACGTGKHALALAQLGYAVTGTDVSVGMIEKARENARGASADVRFAVAGFGAIAEVVGGNFDALLCLGNSLPHVLTPEALAATLADFRACLRPGGVLFVQNRNFDRVLARQERWMPPEAHQEEGGEWLFLRFYDFEPGGLLNFNVVTLKRVEGGAWQQQVSATQLWPQRQGELAAALAAAGFDQVTYWGDMQGAAFAPEQSPNLIFTAHRAI